MRIDGSATQSHLQRVEAGEHGMKISVGMDFGLQLAAVTASPGRRVAKQHRGGA
jgi:hypothetical protein